MFLLNPSQVSSLILDEYKIIKKTGELSPAVIIVNYLLFLIKIYCLTNVNAIEGKELA